LSWLTLRACGETSSRDMGASLGTNADIPRARSGEEVAGRRGGEEVCARGAKGSSIRSEWEPLLPPKDVCRCTFPRPPLCAAI
jgi:hypothetical protein